MFRNVRLRMYFEDGGKRFDDKLNEAHERIFNDNSKIFVLSN